MKIRSIKFSILILATILFGFSAMAQQIPLYSSYTVNPFLISPSFAGDFQPDVNGRLLALSRIQFGGIEGAPVTYIATGDAHFRGQRMGLGGSVYSDSYGLLNQTGASLNYAYHIHFAEDVQLSLGLGADFIQRGIDFSQVKAEDPTENILNLESAKKVTFNGSFGAHFRYKKFLAAFVAPQVYGTQLVQKNYVSNAEYAYQLERHFIAMLSYRVGIGQHLTLDPLVMMRTAESIQPQWDFNIKANFYQKAFISMGYRTGYAVSFGGGVVLNNYLSLAYNYDLPVNDIAGFTSGSHEFGIVFRIRKSQMQQATDAQVNVKQGNDALLSEMSEIKAEVAKGRENQEMQQAEIDKLRAVVATYQGELNEIKAKNQVLIQKTLDRQVHENADDDNSLKQELTATNDSPQHASSSKSVETPRKFYVVIASYKSKEMAMEHQQMLKRNGQTATTYLKKSASGTWYFVYQKSFEDIEAAQAYQTSLGGNLLADEMKPWIYVD